MDRLLTDTPLEMCQIMYYGRRVLEFLSRSVVLRKRLPSQFGGGVMYVTPAARLAYWKPNIAEQ